MGSGSEDGFEACSHHLGVRALTIGPKLDSDHTLIDKHSESIQRTQATSLGIAHEICFWRVRDHVTNDAVVRKLVETDCDSGVNVRKKPDGSAVYDKITNVVTWKAEKILAGTEALIRITMMQGSDEPLSINVQVERLRLPPVFAFIDGFFRCREYL